MERSLTTELNCDLVLLGGTKEQYSLRLRPIQETIARLI